MKNNQNVERSWRRTARARLKMELAGLALAKKLGLSPENYARHLWSAGAPEWMGKTVPTAKEYLLKEAEAFEALFPEVKFKLEKLESGQAELTFTGGCLGGWGKDQWSIAKSLGLSQEEVCRYCCEAFRRWAAQLELEATTEPQADGRCVLKVCNFKNSQAGSL